METWHIHVALHLYYVTFQIISPPPPLSFQQPTGFVFETDLSYQKLNQVEITVFSGDDL